MLENYLIVHKSILPEYYEKVLAVRRLMDSGKCREVSQAVRQVGISRSTYYKYKDFIFEPSDVSGGRKAVLSMMLSHEPGVLSAVLLCLSEAGGSVVTISQSPPIHDLASLTLTLDVSGMTVPLAGLLDTLRAAPGVDSARLLAME